MSQKLNEWMGDSSFVENIPYIKDNESSKAEPLYYWLIGLYGDKPVSSTVLAFTAHADAIADIVDMQFADKWSALKLALSELPTTERTDTKTVTIENTIYGYNDSEGTKDYKNTKTTADSITFDDVFQAVKSSIDLRSELSYYLTIVNDIASVLTQPLYESEV